MLDSSLGLSEGEISTSDIGKSGDSRSGFDMGCVMDSIGFTRRFLMWHKKILNTGCFELVDKIRS